MKLTGVTAKATILGKVANMVSDRVNWYSEDDHSWHTSYYRAFYVEYEDSYMGRKGKMVHSAMRQYVIAWNDPARKIRDEIVDGDVVFIEGRLKSREPVHFVQEVFIEIEEPDDITKIPKERIDDETRG